MKLLFTDLDGTLLTSDKTISKETQKSLLTYLDAGHKLVLSSGRPLQSILQIKETFQIPDKNVYIISFNGANIYDCEEKAQLYSSRLLENCVQKILAISYTNMIHCHAYSDTEIVSEKDTKELAVYKNHVNIPVKIVNNISTYLQKPPYKLLAISLDNTEKLITLQRLIQAAFPKDITTIFSNPHYLEIFSSCAGKGNALVFLANFLQVPLQDTIAIGDAENDITMIQAAGCGVAIKNANSITKNSANYVSTYTNDEDGIIEIINTFVYKHKK